MSQDKATTCSFRDRWAHAFISPMPWKRLLAYITGTVDQELLLRNDIRCSLRGLLKYYYLSVG